MKVFLCAAILFLATVLSAQYNTGFDDWPIIAEGEWTYDSPEGSWSSSGCYCNFGNTLSGLRKIGFNDPGDHLQLPSVSYPERVRFQARTSTGSAAELAVEYLDGGTWVVAGACPVLTEEFTLCDIPLDAPGEDVPLRIVMTAFGNSVFLDDLEVGRTFLPVSLAAFTATAEGGSVQLRWRTLSERNNARFIVQRSRDARHFKDIATRAGGGNATLPRNYLFRDENPGEGLWYYRLRQQDHDGRSSYSDVVSVHIRVGAPLLTLFPTVVRDRLTIRLQPASREAYVEVVDRQGMRLGRQRIPPHTGEWQLHLSHLASGRYYLLFTGQEGRQVRAFVKS